jgi:hypothetical protein
VAKNLELAEKTSAGFCRLQSVGPRVPDLIEVAIGIAAVVRALAACARQNPVRRVLSPVAYPTLASFEAV